MSSVTAGRRRLGMGTPGRSEGVVILVVVAVGLLAGWLLLGRAGGGGPAGGRPAAPARSPLPRPAAAQPSPPPATPARSAPASPAASPAPSPSPVAGQRLRVANTGGVGVVLRASPRLEDRTPRGLVEGTWVTVLERAGTDWVRVRGDDGQEGWVPARYLAP